MRRLATLLLGTTSLFGFADAASAADMAPRMVTKAPVVSPVTKWTGCYFGGHVGAGWGRKDVAGDDFGREAEFDGFRDKIDGFFGGVQAGCDVQLDRNWVVGVEGQFSWGDIKGDFFNDPFFSSKGSGSGTFSARTDWLANAAVRFGYTTDHWMLYGKAGVAWAHDRYTLVTSGVSFDLAGSETRTGWLVGVGLEYRFLRNLSGKVEYNYMDFGSRRVVLAGTSGSEPFSPDVAIDQKIHTIKVGLNYRFDTIR